MKIKILLKYSKMYEKLGEIAKKNREAYCKLHGYTLVVDDVEISSKYGDHRWDRYDAIKKHLHDCDWLVWTDVDALIMNPSITLESIIGLAQNNEDIIGGFFRYGKLGADEDYSIHTGVLFIKNSEWIHNEFFNKFSEIRTVVRNMKHYMADEHTLSIIHKNEKYKNHFKLIRLDRICSIPGQTVVESESIESYQENLSTIGLIRFQKNSVPQMSNIRIYHIGDFILHYASPLTIELKHIFMKNFESEAELHWGQCLPPENLDFKNKIHRNFLLNIGAMSIRVKTQLLLEEQSNG